MHFLWFKNHIKYLPDFLTKKGKTAFKTHFKPGQWSDLNGFEILQPVLKFQE